MDVREMMKQTTSMLGKKEIVAALKAKVASKAITQKEIADALNVPSSRITELFKDEWELRVDHAKVLVEKFRIAEPITFNLGALQAILKGMLFGRVPDHALEGEAETIAYALQYMLRRISENPALVENPDALIEASRSAVARPDPPKHA